MYRVCHRETTSLVRYSCFIVHSGSHISLLNKRYLTTTVVPYLFNGVVTAEIRHPQYNKQYWTARTLTVIGLDCILCAFTTVEQCNAITTAGTPVETCGNNQVCVTGIRQTGAGVYIVQKACSVATFCATVMAANDPTCSPSPITVPLGGTCVFDCCTTDSCNNRALSLTGNTPKIRRDPCEPNPCGNGFCRRNLATNTFECDCPVNAIGDRCQVEITVVTAPCVTFNPCLNDGVCNPAPGAPGFTCDCPPLVFGNLCQLDARKAKPNEKGFGIVTKEDMPDMSKVKSYRFDIDVVDKIKEEHPENNVRSYVFNYDVKDENRNVNEFVNQLTQTLDPSHFRFGQDSLGSINGSTTYPHSPRPFENPWKDQGFHSFATNILKKLKMHTQDSENVYRNSYRRRTELGHKYATDTPDRPFDRIQSHIQSRFQLHNHRDMSKKYTDLISTIVKDFMSQRDTHNKKSDSHGPDYNKDYRRFDERNNRGRQNRNHRYRSTFTYNHRSRTHEREDANKPSRSENAPERFTFDYSPDSSRRHSDTRKHKKDYGTDRYSSKHRDDHASKRNPADVWGGYNKEEEDRYKSRELILSGRDRSRKNRYRKRNRPSHHRRRYTH